LTADQIIKLYDMAPLLPEGGYIKVIKTSETIIKKEHLPDKYTSDKPIYGTILFLITQDSFSKLHFLPTDGVYHFYLGDPVEQLQLFKDGSGRIIRMGHDILNGELIQSIAPADAWHGTRLLSGGKFALVGTTMSPGYTDNDYIHGSAKKLIERYPKFEKEILHFT